MWHQIPPRVDKILAILVYITETLGRLGRFKRSKYYFTDGTGDRNDSDSSIH